MKLKTTPEDFVEYLKKEHDIDFEKMFGEYTSAIVACFGMYGTTCYKDGYTEGVEDSKSFIEKAHKELKETCISVVQDWSAENIGKNYGDRIANKLKENLNEKR